MFIIDFKQSPAMCEVVNNPGQKSYNPRFIDALIYAKVCPGLEKQ
jgi:hypothetical protein